MRFELERQQKLRAAMGQVRSNATIEEIRNQHVNNIASNEAATDV